MSLDLVAVDVETANSDWGSICAIGWSVIRAGEIVETHDVLCHPPASVSRFLPRYTAIHGITADDVARQPSFGEIAPSIVESWGSAPVVAHKASFDVGAIRKAYGHCGLPLPAVRYGCTLEWSRRLLALPRHRLPDVCRHLGVVQGRHHQAGADANAAAQVVLALAKLVGAESLDSLLAATGHSLRWL